MELKLVLKGRVDSAMGTGEGEQKDNLTNSRLLGSAYFTVK